MEQHTSQPLPLAQPRSCPRGWSMISRFCCLVIFAAGLLAFAPADVVAESTTPAVASQSSSTSSDADEASMEADDTGDDDDDAASPQSRRERERPGQRRVRKNNPAEELDEKDMPDALAVLRDYRPELVKRFEDWASRHPENARTMLSRSVPMMQRLIRIRREDPEGYRLAIEDLRYYNFTAELSKQLRTARSNKDTQEVEVLSRKLRTLLTRHFEVRQKIREREIQKLEQRIEQLREQLSERAEAREKILDSRLEQLSDPSVKSPW